MGTRADPAGAGAEVWEYHLPWTLTSVQSWTDSPGRSSGIPCWNCTRVLAAMVADRERGRAMALVTFGLSAGTVAGVPVGMLIGRWAGWRWTMGLVVAIGVISMAAVLARRAPCPAIAVVRIGANLRLLRTPAIAAGAAWPRGRSPWCGCGCGCGASAESPVRP